MSTRRTYYFLLILVVLLATTGFVFFRHANTIVKDIPLTNEKALKVTVNAGFSDIWISRGSPGSLLHANIDADLNHDIGNYIVYSNRDETGYLDINTSEEVNTSSREEHHHTINFTGFGSNTWDMHFTDAVPISYDIQLGVGKADLDFTGMMVKDLNVSAGASSFNMHFDKPNPTVIEDLNIESGLSKFRAEGLCNANFRHLKFQGGVGTYVLDFSGSLNTEVEVDIEVGLGTLTVIVPHGAGARVDYQKSIIAHLAVPDGFSEQEENSYFSSNYYEAKGKMNMHIEAGLGSVTIRQE
ncbi:MAG TPA: LiaF domain-containing protein [Bacteroidota bacterium]|nr:LiaF domain-containing protein [Bacteroidota bacterium]